MDHQPTEGFTGHIDADQLPFAIRTAPASSIERTGQSSALPADAVASSDILAEVAGPDGGEKQFAVAPDFHGVVRRMIERASNE